MSFEYGESPAKENPHKNDCARAWSVVAKAVGEVSLVLQVRCCIGLVGYAAVAHVGI